jgi:dienelactone hydrolase
MRFSDFFGPYLKEGKEAVRRDLGEVDRRFQSLASRSAPLRPGTWPLLVFSHGNGGFRHQNAFQMEHLASHGYVVASPDHTGNSRLSPLPSKAVGYDRSGRSQSASDRPRDVTFLIDRLTSPDLPEIGWLRGAVDRGIIGVLGHSFGGFTAVRLAEAEPRIKAILPMTVAFVARPSSVPTMVMLGAQDRTVGKAGNLASRGYYLGCTGPHHLFVLRRGGHFTFTDMALLNPDFGDGIGRGKGADGEVMDFVPDRLGKEIINAYTLAFFERYLRGSEAAGRYLSENHYPEELEWWDGDAPIRPANGAPKKQRF